MTLVYVFPGQGSQHKGMGSGLFERYPQLVQQVDEQLGYSIEELCLQDPNNVLGQTEYTQPALYTVNALSYLKHMEEGGAGADYLAGHSLGEFNALFAAGAFDFITGLKLVQKRGELMSTAPKGAMAAVMGLNLDQIRSIIKEEGFDGIDVANINSSQQTILSGLFDDIKNCESAFVNAGAKYVRLNVSAAFHSRYMEPIKNEYESFLDSFEFNALGTDVVANYTADLYPKTDYKDYIIKQLTHSVKWYESISWLLLKDDLQVEEMGPGSVLTKLAMKIKQEPLKKEKIRAARKLLFMYSGQGSQYYNMGKELYEKNETFKSAMDQCDALIKAKTGQSLIDELYNEERKREEFVDVNFTHPALYSFGYSLTQTLIEKGIEPAGVLGYSLGEYVAATVSGLLSLEEGINLVVEQAKLLSENKTEGGMLTVLNDVKHFNENPDVYKGATLAGVNYESNFVLSGDKSLLEEIKSALDEASIVSLLLPVRVGFHSKSIDASENKFKAYIAELQTGQATMPFYSASLKGKVEQLNPDYLWGVIREEIQFRPLVESLHADHDYLYVDLSPTGTLSSFLKYGKFDEMNHYSTINQFGKNVQSIDKLLAELS